MHIVGIDPSRVSGTGYALVYFDSSNRLHLIDSECIRPVMQTDNDTERRIANRVVEKIRENGPPDFIAVELPRDIRNVVYRTRTGQKTRPFVSSSQWRLIGRILQAVETYAPTLAVGPDDVKRAAGLSATAKRKPIAEIERLFRIQLGGFKYQRGAIADACAAALAGRARAFLDAKLPRG